MQLTHQLSILFLSFILLDLSLAAFVSRATTVGSAPTTCTLPSKIAQCATNSEFDNEKSNFVTRKPRQSDNINSSSRRYFLSWTTAATLSLANAKEASAATRTPLPDLLYRILRVREATQQETRLIKSGKFKDVQRANVKLAVRFMVDNYRLNDAFVGASAYLDTNDRRVQAGQVGQTAVQNLYTILEYFDSSDVQNLKVGTGDGMGGKEELVLKGLDATRKSIDDFLAYFPVDQVNAVQSKIKEENDLNAAEFDTSFGQILNPPTPKS